MSKIKRFKRLIRYMLELRFFPNLSMFLFQNELWLRIRPIKRFLKTVDPQKTKRIVDIGGGTGRIEKLLNRTDIHIHDINEESIRIARETFANASVGSGDELPFPDNHFDWAISIHTLEHVPKDKREKFILEMIRIAREGVFLNFPEGNHAELLCKNFLKSSEEKDIELNKWSLEHLEMGIPTINEITSILGKQSKVKYKLKSIRGFKAENFYWSRLRASDSFIFKYTMSPLVSLQKYLAYNKKPFVELILIASKEKGIIDTYLKNFN